MGVFLGKPRNSKSCCAIWSGGCVIVSLSVSVDEEHLPWLPESTLQCRLSKYNELLLMLQSGASVELLVHLPIGSIILENATIYSYRARLWSADFLYVGSAAAEDATTLRVSAKIFDNGLYTLLVTRFNSQCTQCVRTSQFVFSTNVSVNTESPRAPLHQMPSCKSFSGAEGRWVRHAAVCPDMIGGINDPGCSFPAAQSMSDKWLWLPFACAYRLPSRAKSLESNTSVLFIGDSTFRFLWGAFVSLFEDEEDQKFLQHGYGMMSSTRLSTFTTRDVSSSSKSNSSAQPKAKLEVKSRCAWDSNLFVWRRGRLQIAYNHPLWTCHNRVQCTWVKRCKVQPEPNRRRFASFVREVAFDYALGATADTASETGCSSTPGANAYLEALEMLRNGQAGRLYLDRRSLVGFMPDNGARLHCVNARIAAHSHVEFGRTTNAPLFNGSIDTFTMSNWLYHFSKADAAMIDAEAILPYFAGDGIHAGQDVNRVLAAMLAVHIFERGFQYARGG